MKNKLPRKYRIISKVHHSDVPENLVFRRYVDRHNGVADDIKTAKTLVLSGFSGGGGLLSKPRAAFHPIDRYKINPNRMSFPCGVDEVHFYTWEPAKGRRPPMHHSTKKRHKLRLTCVFVMQKKVVI